MIGPVEVRTMVDAHEDSQGSKARMDPLSVDRTVFEVTTLAEAEKERYWLDKSIDERWEAIEIHRRIAYGYGDPPPRMKRVLEIIRR